MPDLDLFPHQVHPPGRRTLKFTDADFDQEDLVLDYVPIAGACMADMEDGEQPWDTAPFPFVDPLPEQASEADIAAPRLVSAAAA